MSDGCAGSRASWRAVSRLTSSLTGALTGSPSYVATMSADQSRDLFATVKRLHSSAVMNAEALRKLAKKFDKRAVARGDSLLTSALLPQLYAAPFMAYTNLEGHIETLRDSLIVEEEEDELIEDSEMHVIKQKATAATKDSMDVKRRAAELSWLHDMAGRIPEKELSCLVAHRGYHCPRDSSGKRPLENSLSAFEVAWSAGLQLAECDVALTKDERLVLAHDEDFTRLALDPSKSNSKKRVGDLTLREIISLTCRGGSRPPLLLDVLRSAEAIGGPARLVVEVKPGNREACTALVRLFRQHPELIERCAVIMSFDAYTMHKLKSEMSELSLTLRAEAAYARHKRKSETSEPSSRLQATAEPDSTADAPDNAQTPDNDAAPVSPPFKMPEILLITVAEEPQAHYELRVGVADLAPVDSWLRHGDNQPPLDGVYLQYQPEMLRPEGGAALRALARRVRRVGVWGYFGDPDNIATASHLVRECGVSFVNTDLPRSFGEDGGIRHHLSHSLALPQRA